MLNHIQKNVLVRLTFIYRFYMRYIYGKIGTILSLLDEIPVSEYVSEG